MADPNVEAVRRGLEAYNRGDLDTIMSLLDEDVEVYSHPDTGNSGTYRGHEGFLEWSRLWLDAWESFRIEVKEIEALDDEHLIAITDQTARGRGSGIEVQQKGVAYLFELRGGRTTRMGLYLDRETALADLRGG
jgi:ketosteroid isomerase-like protein